MIKTAQERVAHSQALTGRFAIPLEDAMQAEIDELRAELAAQPALVPMTDEQIVELLWVADHDDRGRRAVAIDFARAIEAHHGIRKKEPTDWSAA